MREDKEPRVVVYTFDKPGLSPLQMGIDLQTMFTDLGYRAVCTGSLSDVHNSWILSLRVAQIRQLAQLPRFNKIHGCITMHAQNIEEFSIPEWASVMAYYTYLTQGKVPYSLMSISRWQYNVIKEKMRDIFSPARMRAAFGEESPSILQRFSGILDEFVWSDESDRNQFIVPYNRVDTKQKNCGLHVVITNQVTAVLAARGEKVTHSFYHAVDAGPDTNSKGLDFSGYEVIQQPSDRQGYLTNIKKHGMAICTAGYESLGLYYIELLASGCVVVFLDRPWIRELFPGYKFLAKEEELATMTLKVWENWSAARAYVKEEVLPVIEKNYRMRGVVKKIIEDFGPGIEAARL